MLVWITSQKLVNIQKKNQDLNQSMKQKIFAITGLVLNTVFPLTMCFQYSYNKNPTILKSIKATVCALQGFTCLVLTYSVIRIRQVIKQVKGVDIEVGRLLMHLSAFWLYFLSYMIYFILYNQHKTRSSTLFVSMVLLTVILETVSIALLTYIIWKIFIVTLQQRKQQT